ncbi:MAG: YdcF family protein [Deltaproteobacteria bacterium]|nr:YdcF family protein [Deltaproteobacteria bacterium]
MKKPSRRAAGLLILFALALVLGTWALLRAGRWLVVGDPLAPARAIVVVSGHLPFRAMEAAQIYRQGLAPEVWLTRPSAPQEEKALARLGIAVTREESYNEQVLRRLGVPRNAIRILSEPVLNTEQEVLLISRILEQVGGETVILVTSKYHTRRVKAIWNSLVGDTQKAIVRYAPEDPFDPDRWWRNTRDALAVVRESMGLLNAWAGFPLRPDREQ